MQNYDDAVLECFLEKQLQLFPEKVAENKEEAKDFLEDFLAIVVNGIDEVWDYFSEEGTDLEEMTKEDILEASEVFAVGDGRYLIVEA